MKPEKKNKTCGSLLRIYGNQLWESISTSLESHDFAPFDNFKKMDVASFLRNYLHFTSYIGDFGGMSGPSCTNAIGFLNVLTLLCRKKLHSIYALKYLSFFEKLFFILNPTNWGLPLLQI